MNLKEFFSPDHLLEEFSIVDWGKIADSRPESYQSFLKWLEEGRHGPLGYLGDHRAELREDMKKFFPEFREGLVFLFTYAPQKKQLDEFYQSSNSNGLKMASYVMGFEGDDYHYVIKARLEAIIEQLKEFYPNLKATISLDIQPVLERDFAAKAGLGWFGKNSMLIHPQEGSFVMIGSILLDQKIEELDSIERKMVTDHCGQCRRCIDACPTDAILEGERTIDASKCISTFTIELFKDAEPPKGYDSSDEIFGCDICQDVCPWNKKVFRQWEKRSYPEVQKSERFELITETFLTKSSEQLIEFLESMSNRQFVKRFRSTPLGRTGRKGLLKNLLHKKRNQ